MLWLLESNVGSALGGPDRPQISAAVPAVPEFHAFADEHGLSLVDTGAAVAAAVRDAAGACTGTGIDVVLGELADVGTAGGGHGAVGEPVVEVGEVGVGPDALHERLGGRRRVAPIPAGRTCHRRAAGLGSGCGAGPRQDGGEQRNGQAQPGTRSSGSDGDLFRPVSGHVSSGSGGPVSGSVSPTLTRFITTLVVKRRMSG